MKTRSREWKGSLLVAALIAFAWVTYLNEPFGMTLETLSRFFLALSLGYVSRQAWTQYKARSKNTTCGDGIMGPFPVRCPCECEKGILRSDGRNTQGTLTFLMCNVCNCTYEAEDYKSGLASLRQAVANQVKSEESIFQRDDGSWGWYNETWNEGDDIRYKTKEAATAAQTLYAKHVLGI